MLLNGSLLAAIVGPAFVTAASNFAGSNLYYAAGINATARTTLLKGLQSANMKVLHVWIGAQSGNQKVTPFPDVEPSKICNGDASCYDPTVLNLLDDFMVDAHNYGVKLLITMHSFNALQAGDVYGKQYGTGYFYDQTAPQQAFDKRLHDYIFGFEAENEAMIGKGEAYIQSHTAWQCDRATTIKNTLGSNSGIQVLTGGESWVNESVQSAWLSCAALDVISLHAYGVGDFATSSLQTYVIEAKNAGKKLIMEEWGACYYTTENNNCPAGSVLPNSDPHANRYRDPSWSTLQTAAKAAYSTTGAFDFSAYLP
ncbi:glycoside hydrolase [Cerioporus squamosus]|nr:glycoside hydrolase [Cerioporus squamosus]